MKKIINITLICLTYFAGSGQKISYQNADQINYTAIPNASVLNSTFALPIATKAIKVNNETTAFTIKINDAVAAIVPTAAAGSSFIYTLPANANKIELDKPSSTDKYILTMLAVVAPPSKISYLNADQINYTNIPDASVLNTTFSLPIATKSIKVNNEPTAFTIKINDAAAAIVPSAAAGSSFIYPLPANANKIELDKPTSADKYILTMPLAVVPSSKISYLNADQLNYTDIPDGSVLNATFQLPIATKAIKINNETIAFTIKINDATAAIIPTAAGSSFIYLLPDNANKIELDKPGSTDKFTMLMPSNLPPAGGGGTSSNSSIYQQYVVDAYDAKNSFKLTSYGLLINQTVKSLPYIYGGPNYIHIFLDELGNSIITTIPQGIPDMRYVVHVIFNTTSAGKNVTYGISTTGGNFLGGINLETTGASSTGALQATSTTTMGEYTLLLKTPGSNMNFTVSRFEDGKLTTTSNYTITMTSNFTGNINVGLLNSWLANPTFSLVNDPNNPNQQVVKSSGGNNRGVVTIFATFYTSPITLIKYYIDKAHHKEIVNDNNPVADFQLYSKNYLYTRPIWERIYPTIGVGINDNVFQNLFFGLSWEFARGGSFFVGGHYGNVNVFNAPAGFQFAKTDLTQDQFNLYSNTAWKVGWSVGASVDFSILGNLFKSTAQL